MSWRWLLLSLLLLAPLAQAESKILPWMMADWENPTPHLADTGISARELALSIGRRLVVFSHAERDITIPSGKGPRAFGKARFVTAVARVDIPADTMRRRMQDFGSYRHLFPMLTESQVMRLDGPNVVARYRLEIPLPALATFTVDFRIKHALEKDGSISALLIDGKAESLIAMLGGVSDELADQPVLSRWEFIPLNAQQSLLVFTYWDRVELKSYFSRKFMQEYPELKVIGPYMVAAGAAESVHRNFLAPQPLKGEPNPPDIASLAKMRGLMETLTPYGHVAVMEPEQAVSSGLKVPPLRYAALATRIQTPPAASRRLSTIYERLPELHKEVRKVGVQDHGRQLDLKLDIRFAFMIIRFSLDLDLDLNWLRPDKVEFRRTAGELAQLRGMSEWLPIEGSNDTLMLISAAHEVGEGAPLVLRMAHSIVERIPYIDPLSSMTVQLVVMERLKPWIEKQAAAERAARPATP
ncbi:MAG TPA: hypothetical protein VF050_12395 [Moraxellaceae bacterium]